MKLSHFMGGVALSALIVAVPSTAHAQSTGTQEVEKQDVEKVVVTGQKNGTGGTIVKERRPKTRSTVTGKYLDTQSGGQTIFQSINLVPGMVFQNSDPYGSSGGTTRLRGFDGNRVSLTVDGIPLNDTGNYAIFTNQMIDPEYLSRVTVNTGTTDVDSPTASATGGSINVVTRRPFEEMTLSMNASAGSWNYHRFLAMFDTGEYRGVSAFAGVSDQQYDKFKGPGMEKKTQYNGRIYQVIGEDSYISLIGHYNENRNNFYRNLSKTEIANFGMSYDNFATCTRAAVSNGVANDDGASPNPAPVGGATSDNILNPSSCTNYYNLRVNPSNTGNVRMQGNFKLSDSVRLTVDPSWQYVKANGGGTTVVSEDGPTEKRLGPAGLDLNGDGDVLDKVRLYTPNNTNTSRYGVNASLIWNLDDSDTFRVAYTADNGRHRQTGAFSKLDANGNPVAIFGGLDVASAVITGTDGNVLRGRDRLSHAILNQVSASYTGQFLDDALLVDVGLRAPYFTRDLNQYCYTQANSSNVLCTKEAFTDVDGDGIGTFASTGATSYIAPRSEHFEYNALLPNVGVSYELAPSNIVFASYAEGFSAPRTDNLYTFGIGSVGAVETPAIDPVVSLAVQPEKTKAFDLGYRYQGQEVTASASAWYNTFENRIVSSFDPDLGVNVDRNIGSVVLQGIDAEVGWQASPSLVVYASASFVSSEVQDNIPARTATGFLPTKGKELVETPNVTFSGRAAYALNKNLTIGLQGKYVGERWATDVNDEKTKAFMTFDADLQLDLTDLGLKNMLLQLNAINLLDKDYLGTISTTTNAQTILDVDAVTAGNQTQNGSTVRYGVGAPQTFQIQLKTRF